MKRYSVWPPCISFETFERFKIGPFPMSFFRKPQRRSIWQMASTTPFLTTPQWTSRKIAEKVDSVYPSLIVRHASVNQAVGVPFTIIKAILSSHPTWTHVKQFRSQKMEQSNWHLFESSLSKSPILSIQFSMLLNQCSPEINSWECLVGNDWDSRR